MQSKKRKGFTLVELIVVIAILAVLAAAAIAAYSSLTRNARESTARNNAGTIVRAVNNFNSVITDQSLRLSGPSDVSGKVVGTTLDLSVGPSHSTYKAPIDMEIEVVMTANEWTDAMKYVGTIQPYKFTVLDTPTS